LEGQAATYSLDRGKFSLYSHNVKLKPETSNNWSKIEKKYHIEELLREYKKIYNIDLCIQGEIIGPGIQNNVYGLGEIKFYIYRIKDLTNNICIPYSFLNETIYDKLFRISNPKDFTPLISVPRVAPFESKLLNSIKEIIDHSESEMSILNSKVLREGVVWRSTTNQDIGFKAKSPKYDIFFNGKQETE